MPLTMRKDYKEPKESKAPPAAKPTDEEPKQEELELGGDPADGATEEVVVVESSKPDEATLRLQKQIEELKKSEELQRNYAAQAMREREEALRVAREQAARVEQYQRESQEQEETAIGASLAAAKAELKQAQADKLAALNAGDNAAAVEADARLAVAAARMDRLEIGQNELEARKKAPKQEQKPIPTVSPTGDPIDAYNLPDDCKTWLKTHRDYITDPRKAIDLDAAHRRAGLEGLAPGNPRYLPYIESQLFPPESEVERERQTNERPSIMSAPVSRETPSAGGQRSTRSIRLTPDQKEAAKLAGISEVEYAKQLQKLNELKGDGNYTERRYG